MLRFIITLNAIIWWSTLVFASPDQAALDKRVSIESRLETSGRKNAVDALQEQYGGLVMDETITVTGHDFYQYFVALWRDKPMNERFAVTVRERPSARWGNQVSIEYAQRRVFEAVLPPSSSNIKAVSERAVESSYQNVIDTDTQRLFFRDQDIGPDEM